MRCDSCRHDHVDIKPLPGSWRQKFICLRCVGQMLRLNKRWYD